MARYSEQACVRALGLLFVNDSKLLPRHMFDADMSGCGNVVEYVHSFDILICRANAAHLLALRPEAATCNDWTLKVSGSVLQSLITRQTLASHPSAHFSTLNLACGCCSFKFEFLSWVEPNLVRINQIEQNQTE